MCPKYVIIHIFYHCKNVYQLKNPLYCIYSTVYHLWINFKTKNHQVYNLVFWLQAPKEGEINLFSPSFMFIQLFRSCCPYSTICMTHIQPFFPSCNTVEPFYMLNHLIFSYISTILTNNLINLALTQLD